MGYYYELPEEVVYAFYYVRPMRSREVGECDQCESVVLLEFWLYRESEEGLRKIGRLCHRCAEEYDEV